MYKYERKSVQDILEANESTQEVQEESTKEKQTQEIIRIIKKITKYFENHKNHQMTLQVNILQAQLRTRLQENHMTHTSRYLR